MKKLISFLKKTRPSQLLTSSLLGVVFSISTAYAFTNIKWSTVAPSPIGRSEAQGAVVEGKLYVFGGNLLRADVYNPDTNTWRRIADLPRRITHAGTAVVGRNIYLAGGYVNKPGGGVIFAIPDVWRYNVDKNKWFNDTPPLPEARGSGGLEILNGKLHFFAGTDIRRVDKRDHWVLSLNGETRWTLAAPLPKARNHMGDAVLGGKLYAIGGQITQDHKGAQYFVDRWEPATNTWSAVARLPRARSHTAAATFVMDNRIIVAGGIDTNGASVRDVTIYNPFSNKWTELTPLPVVGAFAGGQSSGVAGSINGNIFYTTGRGFQKTTYKGKPVLVFP
jgi:N-acetylneuraminic acid mutarotase